MLLFYRHPGDERLVGTHVVKEEISKPVLFFSPSFFFPFQAESMPSVFFRIPAAFPPSCFCLSPRVLPIFCLNLEREDADLSLMGLYWNRSPLNLREFISTIALTMTAGSALLRKITASLALSASTQRSDEPSEPEIESDRIQHQHREHSQ